VKLIVSEALLVHRVDYGESDVIATLLTETDGKLGVLVRGARKSTRRVGGALEPFHTIEVRLEDRGGELATLKESRITRVRAGIVSDLDALDAAGTALRWARHACPPRTREPDAWATLHALLDALDAGRTSGRSPRVELAFAALRLLADVGYALDLEHCVRCGRTCPAGQKAGVDPARGGLVCTACGGARVLLEPRLRAMAVAAQVAQIGALPPDATLSDADADVLLSLSHTAMAAHTGFDR
jgi:DNA repair protein RecO (recombination protein O)